MAKVVVTDRGAATITAASVEFRPMNAVLRVLIRTARLYLFTVLGLLGVDTTGVFDPLPPGEFLAQLLVALGYSIGPALVALIVNTLELLAKIDENMPELRA
jgi:hypothetical protein